MTVIRNIILSLCIGGVLYFVTDAVAPSYEYMNQRGQPWPYETKYKRKKPSNPAALGVAVCTALAVFVINPIRQKKATI